MVHYTIHTNTINSFHSVKKKSLVRKYPVMLIYHKHIYVLDSVIDSGLV